MDSEFDLIKRYFARPVPAGFLGGGDDCALFPLKSGMQVAISTDLLIEGRHFLPETDAASLGHKALAVNLSDLAAMGAQPISCVLALSLPHVDHPWLAGFSDGFYTLAEQADCPLVGGDTTRSQAGIVISVTVCGQVTPDRALRRSAAKADDDIWVTGTLGSAYIALQLLTKSMPTDAPLLASTRQKLERPDPPVHFAQKLGGIAHAAIDISDGLAQDLGHILTASGCGAELDYDTLPIDAAIGHLSSQAVRCAVLAGGDVYQLCFTAPAHQRRAIEALARSSGVRVTRIGHITSVPGLIIKDGAGNEITLPAHGFDHFNDD